MARSKLLYYSLYPGDFDNDERVRGMDDAEVGLFIRALNHAWANSGLPSDLEELERVLPGRRTSAEFEKRWRRVSKCFVPDTSGRLINPRQEEEREVAREKSETAKENIRKRWEAIRAKQSGNTPVSVPNESGMPFGNTHRSDQIRSDINPLPPSANVEPDSDLAEAFHRFIDRYPNRIEVDLSAQIWISLAGNGTISAAVIPEIESGLTRWIESDQWTRDDGRFVPSPAKWLRDKRWLDTPPVAAEVKIAKRSAKRSSEGVDPNAEWTMPADWKKGETA